jgi:hypothetical protein
MNEKKFKPCDRKPMFLLPPSLEERLPEGHLAYFIINLVGRLDLTAIYASHRGDVDRRRRLLPREQRAGM